MARAWATSSSCWRTARHFGIDLTYRYQPGALGIAHAIGLARDFVGDDAFCCVLGDNILRGQPLDGIAAEFESGPFGAGTLLYQVPDPERFGVAEFDARRPGRSASRRSRTTPRATSSRSACTSSGRMPSGSSTSSLPSGRGEFEITDVLNHYIPGQGLYSPVYEGHWTDAGTVPSLLRAAELAAADDAAGRLSAPVTRAVG